MPFTGIHYHGTEFSQGLVLFSNKPKLEVINLNQIFWFQSIDQISTTFQPTQSTDTNSQQEVLIVLKFMT